MCKLYTDFTNLYASFTPFNPKSSREQASKSEGIAITILSTKNESFIFNEQNTEITSPEILRLHVVSLRMTNSNPNHPFGKLRDLNKVGEPAEPNH